MAGAEATPEAEAGALTSAAAVVVVITVPASLAAAAAMQLRVHTLVVVRELTRARAGHITTVVTASVITADTVAGMGIAATVMAEVSTSDSE